MKELKNKFYRETEFLIGDPFKNHSRDAIWTWIEDKLSRPVQPQVIKKNAKGLLPCPFCGRKPRLEGTQPFLINEQKQTFRFICDCRCTVIDSVEKARDYWNKRK